MSKIIAIAKKELGTYFRSPIAYIVIILMLAVFNVFFFVIIDENREASLVDVFKAMEFMFVSFLPLITMKMFSEEKSTGTIEFLMTSPVKTIEIVLGKYLGTLIFFSFLWAVTLSYYAILGAYGTPDKNALLAGYLGIWLEGAFFIAIGMLASSWTKNQIIAAITTYVCLFFLYVAILFDKYLTGFASKLLDSVSTYTHAGNFFIGVITLSDVTYFLSGILVMILLTNMSIPNRS